MAMILPFIEQAPLYNLANFNHYWDTTAAGANNRIVNRTFLPAFACPSDPFSKQYAVDSAPSNYALSAGPASNWNMGNNNPGMFTLNSSVSIRDVTDGTSNTVLASEVQIGRNDGDQTRISYRNSGAGDLTPPAPAPAYKFGASAAHIAVIKAYHTACKAGVASSVIGEDDEANRWWAAGTVFRGPWFNTLMPPNTPVNCDNDASVTDMRLKSASSYHTGGAQAVLVDGSVRFVSENIDTGIWIGVGSKDGGETLGEW